MASQTVAAPVDIILSNYPVLATKFSVKASTAVSQYQVLMFTASATTVEPWDGTDNAKLMIAMHSVGATDTDRTVQVYTSGEFNQAAVIFPAGITTLDAKRKAFVGTAITINRTV